MRFADGGWPEDVELLDDSAGGGSLEEEYRAHSESLVRVWRRRGGRGPHALRGLATDAYAAALDAACAVPSTAPRARSACCLAYKVPGGDLCAGCPRTLLRSPMEGNPCSA